jgi:hypothetical protein
MAEENGGSAETNSGEAGRMEQLSERLKLAVSKFRV